MRVTFQNDETTIERLMTAVDSFAEQENLAEGQVNKLRLCLDELVVNIINYGYPNGEPGQIHLELQRVDGVVKTILSDDGRAFNPFEEAAEPDIEASLEDRAIGGLGVFFVRETAREINYRRADERNVVSFEIA